MNCEITTMRLKRDMALFLRDCENTRPSAARQLRQSGAQKTHGKSAPGLEQLQPSGV